MTFQNIIDFFKGLFGVKPRMTSAEQSRHQQFDEGYADTHDVNLTALVSNKLSNMVVSDSEITVSGESARAEFLNEAVQTCVERLKHVVTRALAVGGVVLKPYIHGGRLYTDILPQARFINVKQVGGVVTEAGFIAESIIRDGKTYVRTECHKLSDTGTYTIEQRATESEREVPLTSVPEWAALQPRVTISGVEQMLFGLITCPVDNRHQMNGVYGVPITYGQDKLIQEITELLYSFQREFCLKETFVGVSAMLFDGKDNLPIDGIYKRFRTPDRDFFEVFSPDIRAQAYIDGINYRLELLEKAIGVNKGILTNLETSDATATAIKRSTFDTWSLVDAMRTNIEKGIAQLVYAFNVYANAANLAPRGEYEIEYDWDYSLLEDTTERFTQLQTGVASGYIAPWEARAWVMGEAPDQAQQNMPEMEALLL